MSIYIKSIVLFSHSHCDLILFYANVHRTMCVCVCSPCKMGDFLSTSSCNRSSILRGIISSRGLILSIISIGRLEKHGWGVLEVSTLSPNLSHTHTIDEMQILFNPKDSSLTVPRFSFNSYVCPFPKISSFHRLY